MRGKCKCNTRIRNNVFRERHFTSKLESSFTKPVPYFIEGKLLSYQISSIILFLRLRERRKWSSALEIRVLSRTARNSLSLDCERIHWLVFCLRLLNLSARKPSIHLARVYRSINVKLATNYILRSLCELSRFCPINRCVRLNLLPYFPSNFL